MLKVFSRFNSNTNEGYSFGIYLLPGFSKVKDAIIYFQNENFINGYSLKIKDKKPLKNNLESFKKLFGNWLFRYQVDELGQGSYLKDVNNKFAWTDKFYQFQFIESIYIEISKIDQFISLTEISYDTDKEFYECEYNDYILLGENHSIYLHFGVSD